MQGLAWREQTSNVNVIETIDTQLCPYIRPRTDSTWPYGVVQIYKENAVAQGGREFFLQLLQSVQNCT